MAGVTLLPIAISIVNKLVSVTGDRVGNHILNEFKAAKSVKQDLRVISRDLAAICAVLQDAQEKQYTNATMKIWLTDLKKVVYDIEDLLDDVASDSLRRSLNKGHFVSEVRYFFSASHPLFSSVDLSHKIKRIRREMERIAASKNSLGLTERLVEVERPTRDLFNDISYVNKSMVVRRVKAEKQVMHRLLTVGGDANCPSVFPIVGIGGIGKTTLAKSVYNDVHTGFDIKIWAYVSDQFNLIKLLEDIIRDASSVNMTNTNYTLELLVKKVQDCLRGKKYLLVLDDVWVEDYHTWADLKSILEVGKTGSVILITTRSAQVASITQTMKLYDLSRLSDEDSWLLFRQLAFSEGEERRYQRLCEIGRSIVKKCDGVPLVVKTIGSLLRRERDSREWERINNMDSFKKLPGEYGKVMQVLRISYDKLPYHLKPCFAYCSLRGKEVELYPTLLVYLWNANGLLVAEDGNDEIEDYGYKCAKELVSRSLLEHRHVLYNDALFSCNIHDLLHELAEEVLGEELAVVHRNDIKVSESTKHIIWGNEGPGGLKDVKFPSNKFLEAKRARTFKFGYRTTNVNRAFLKGVIATFSHLRTLELDDSHFEELPSSIGKLKYLRGLKLSFNPLLKSLPDAVCNLLNLETLDLYWCEKLQKLPDKIYRLTKLRYFVVTTCQKTLVGTKFTRLPSLRFLWIKGCFKLESLWDNDDIGHLNSIRRINIEDCPTLASLPSSMKGLTALEHLVIANCAKLDLEKGECLSGLQSIQSLAITGVPMLKCIPEGFQSAAKSLRYLYIANCENMTGLGNWSQCFTLLAKIIIQNCPNLLALPQGFLHLKFLEQLTINNCQHLSERCTVPNGADYPLIQHVPEFWLDGHCFLA